MKVRMDKEQRANFTGTITELRKHVFEIMDVIVTTASNAGDAKLYEWVQPSMIFVDEAARVPEPDSWSLFAFYAVDTPKILVGIWRSLSHLPITRTGSVSNSPCR